MFCPKCGNEIKPGQKFCTKCGFKVESVEKAVSEKAVSNKETDKSSSSIAPIITGILVALIVIIGAALLVLKFTSNDKDISRSKTKGKATVEEKKDLEDVDDKDEKTSNPDLSSEEVSEMLEDYANSDAIIYAADDDLFKYYEDNGHNGHQCTVLSNDENVGHRFLTQSSNINTEALAVVQKDFDNDGYDELLVINEYEEDRNDMAKQVFPKKIGIHLYMYEVISDGTIQLVADKKMTEFNPDIMQCAEGETKIFVLDDNSLFIESRYILWGYGEEILMEYASVSYDKKQKFVVNEFGSYKESKGNDEEYYEGLSKLGMDQICLDDMIIDGRYPDECIDDKEFVLKFVTRYAYPVEDVLEFLTHGQGMRCADQFYIREDIEIPFLYLE